MAIAAAMMIRRIAASLHHGEALHDASSAGANLA